VGHWSSIGPLVPVRKIQSNQTEASAAGKGSAGRNGGTQRNQPVPQRTEQSRDVTSQESTGSERRALTRSGSRQLMSAAQNPFATMRQLSRDRMLERDYGSFYRTVPLPQGANQDEIEAVMRDGVLKVTVPLAENARPRRIQIQS
jgi:hypothetical protein